MGIDMRILVTGGSGLLGRYLDRVMDAEFTWNTTKQSWTHHRMDVRDKDGIAYIFAKIRPDVVVHMAATGDVDWCEQNYTLAEDIVVGGTMNIRQACREYASKLVYISSNAVFSGDDPPYAPDAERKPVNRYGTFRARAEDVVARYGHDWLIVRPFLLYGWEPKGARGNWASRLVRMLGRGETPSLVGDRYWQPSYAGHVAQALFDLIMEKATGFWHVMGCDRVTLHEFGLLVTDWFGFDSERIRPISSDGLPISIAPRPVDTSYNEEAKNTIVLPGVNEGLIKMRSEECGHHCAVIAPFGWVPEAGCPVHD